MFTDAAVTDLSTGQPARVSPAMLAAMHAQVDVERARLRRGDSDADVHRSFREGMARAIDAVMQSMPRGDASRRDAWSAGAGLYMARDLEYVYDQVLREPTPPMNAQRLFTVDGTVPVGAESHTVRRLYQEGEVGWYKAGKAAKRVDISQRELSFPVKYATTSFGYDVFRQMNAAFAQGTGNISFDIHAEKMRTARERMAQFMNRAFWYGAPDVGLYGVINYPWLPKKAIATAFNSDSDPRDILHELNRLANFPHEQSNTIYQPNAMAMSPALRNYIFTTPWSPLDSTGKTIGVYFLENHPRINAIEEAWELSAIGPSDEDGILVYKNDRNGVALVHPGGPFNALPPQEVKFELEINCWSACGGVIMRDVGANVLGFATPPTD